MKKKSKYFRLNNKKRANGSVIVITAIGIFVFIGIAALAIDVGYLYATRSETQNAADAAALAGARELAQIYNDYREGVSPRKDMIVEEDGKFVLKDTGYNAILALITTVASNNKAAKEGIIIDPIDVKIGNWNAEYDEDVGILQPNGSIEYLDPDDPTDQNLVQPDAVRVIARRTGVGTFFANIFKIAATQDVSSTKAIAALSGPGEAEDGVANTPFGLASHLFPDNCRGTVQFYPTTDSCAGWHGFIWGKTETQQKIFDIIAGHTFEGDVLEGPGYFENDDLLDGAEWLEKNFNIDTTENITAPPIIAGETVFEFHPGTVSDIMNGDSFLRSDYDGNGGIVIKQNGNEIYDSDDPDLDEKDKSKNVAAMTAMFDYFRYRDHDGDPDKWTTFSPVYLDEDCENPANDRLIIGFAYIEISNVNNVPDKTMDVYLPCEPVILPDRGNGIGAFGNLFGLIPNLVK